MGKQGRAHWSAVAAIAFWVFRNVQPGLVASCQGPLRLSEEDEPEPDVFVHSALLDVNAVRGPDAALLIEVADSSLRKDQLLKAPMYARHGVPVFWLVDLNTRTTWVHRLQAEAAYRVAPTPFTDALRVPVLAAPLVLAELPLGEG
jgi:Uma2 family endonuclease